MKIEVVRHHSDSANGNKMLQRIETTDAGGVLEDGCPLVLGYEHELWKEMAKQAALLISSMIGSHQSQMTQETIHEALKLKQCILDGTPEKIDWIVAAAQKNIGMETENGD